MASSTVVNGTAGNDVLTGTTGDDLMNGGAGNDRINGGAGNDLISGGDGNDTLTGDAGNDTLVGGNGDDGFFGGGGDDLIYGDAGKNTAFGDAGNDTFVHRVGEGIDTFNGGTGNDAIQIELSSAQLTDAVRADLATLHAWMTGQISSVNGNTATLNAQSSGGSVTFSALGLTISTVEQTTIVLDGKVVPLASLINSAPVIVDASTDAVLSVAHGKSVAGSIAATDANGDTLSYSVGTGPAHGTITFTDTAGHYTYTAGDSVGADSFTLQVSDGRGGTTTKTVAVNLTNAGPVVDAQASDAALTVAHGKTVVGQVVATDADGDTLSYSVGTGPAHGTVTFTDDAGHYTYTAGDSVGADSFTLQVSDGHGGTTTKTVDVNLTNAGPVVDAQASDAALTVAHGKTVVGQVVATDADGDTLSYSVGTGPAHGTVTFTDDAGYYTYTAGDSVGADSFTLQVSDGHGGVTTQTVEVSLTNSAPEVIIPPTIMALSAVIQPEAGANAAPTVDPVIAQLSSLEDQKFVGHVMATDQDGDALTFTATAGPQHGALVVDQVTGDYVYTPTGNFSGSDTFDITVDDGFGGKATQTIVMNVDSVADAPALAVVNPVVIPASVVMLGLQANSALIGGSGNDVLDGSSQVHISVGLDVTSALTDLDGSETLSVRIGGVPQGGILSAGQNNGDGTWTLSPSDLAGLKLTADVTSNFTISVAATSTESDGQTATSSATIDVQLATNSNVILGGGGDDKIAGSEGNDTLYGNTGNDTILGNAGNDTIYGGKGNDVVSGGDGNDQLFGDSGNDTISDDTGNDRAVGGSGDDILIAGEGNDFYDGGSGSDTLDFSGAKGGLAIDVSLKTASGMGNDTFSGIEKIIGSAFTDTYKGSSGNDVFFAGAGDDTIRGMAGNDTFTGGAGNDTFVWFMKDVVSGQQNIGVDTITDFAPGDKLDLHDFLKSAKYANIGDVVRVTDQADGTVVSVKQGASFFDVVKLSDFHGHTAADMLKDGMLLT